MPNYYAYLRVSRDTQDVANQRLGLLDYANRQGYAPVIMLEDTASGTVPWSERKLGKLISETASPGDVILTAEFSRIGRHLLQIVDVLIAATARRITIVITKENLVLDASIDAQIKIALYGLMASIERDLISRRTKEALQVARLGGKNLGRPRGSSGKLKLDPRKEEVGELHELGVSTPKLAKRFGVTEKTMRKFLARHFPKDSA